MIVVSLYDRVAQNYRNVTVDINNATARRNLGYAVNNTPQLLYEAKDLDLMQVGDFDEHTGTITPCVPFVICHASEVISDD